MKLGIVFVLAGLISSEAHAAYSKICREKGYFYINDKKRNIPDGGFVSHSADVSDSKYVYIAPTATVCGSASVSGSVRIYGYSVIRDNAIISEQAQIFGSAVVRGNSEISGYAKIFGYAVVEGDSVITGKVRVYENALVSGSSFISGDTRIKGYSKINNQDIDGGVINSDQYTQAETEQRRNRAAEIKQLKAYVMDVKRTFKEELENWKFRVSTLRYSADFTQTIDLRGDLCTFKFRLYSEWVDPVYIEESFDLRLQDKAKAALGFYKVAKNNKEYDYYLAKFKNTKRHREYGIYAPAMAIWPDGTKQGKFGYSRDLKESNLSYPDSHYPEGDVFVFGSEKYRKWFDDTITKAFVACKNIHK